MWFFNELKQILKVDNLNLKNSENFILSDEDITDYVLNRFENLKKEPTINKLVQFHTSNKFLLMSHNQDKLRLLGNIVANHKITTSDCITDYEIHLRETLSSTPTIKRHINTLLYVFGHFSRDFGQSQKELFLNFIEEFREGKITLGQHYVK